MHLTDILLAVNILSSPQIDALIRKMVFEGVVDETLWESLRDIERAEGDNAQEGAAAQAGLEWMRGRHSFCW